LRPLWMRRAEDQADLVPGARDPGLSRIICSRKIRPVTGLSSIWVRLNSACTTEDVVAVAPRRCRPR